jgi:MFS family permease
MNHKLSAPSPLDTASRLSESSPSPQPEATSSPLAKPTRVRYGVLGFAGVLSMITYLDRVCMSNIAPEIQREFGLSNTQLGWLFTAFAFAYAAFEIPSGWLGDVFGARRTLIRIVLWWSCFTALTGAIYPSAEWPALGFLALLAVRFLFGIGEAGAYPNIARAFHSWFPFQERGFAQGTVWMAGRFAGGITPLIVLSLIFRTPTADGGETVHWRHAFWIFGSLGVIWCIAWWWWFRDRPEEHRGVNPAELAYIRGQRASAAPGTNALLHEKSTGIKTLETPDMVRGESETLSAQGIVGAKDLPPVPPPAAGAITALPHEPVEDAGHSGVPWGRMVTSVNLWSLCLMYFCGAYGWYFNITWLPKYLGSHHGVSVQTHGFWTMSFLSGAPLLFGSLACLVGGLLTDAFIRQTGNRKWGRRLFGVLGHGACATCYFLSLTATSPWTFVAMITLATFCNDLTMGSAWASCLDIGRKYSGIVSGCMNMVGNMGGAAAGIVTGWVLELFGVETGWTVNFLIFGGVYLAAVLFWLRFDATDALVTED